MGGTTEDGGSWVYAAAQGSSGLAPGAAAGAGRRCWAGFCRAAGRVGQKQPPQQHRSSPSATMPAQQQQRRGRCLGAGRHLQGACP